MKISRQILLVSLLILITSPWFFYLVNNKDPFSIRTVILEKPFFKEPQLKDRIHAYLNQCSPHLPMTFCRLVYNKPVFLLSTFVISFINHFSPETLFVKGAASPFPVFLFLFFYSGLFKALIGYKKHKTFLLLLFLYAFIPSFFYGFDYRVSILGLPLLSYLIAAGLGKFYSTIYRKNLWLGRLAIVCLIFLFLQHLGEIYLFYYS